MQLDAVSVSEQRAVARIAGALAHELNNPLQGVLSLVGVTLRECRLDERCQSRLEQIHHGVSRLSRTVASLSAIYENLPRSPDLVALNDLLSSLARTLVERGFRVQLDTEQSEVAVYCFRPELARLIGDLVLENTAESQTVYLSAWDNSTGAGFRCDVGTPAALVDPSEWQSLEEARGVSGLAVLVDELVALSRGRAEFRWSDSRLTGMRFWMRTA